MRRLTAAAVAVLGILIAQSAVAGAAKTNDQRWLVLTRPGEPTQVVATGVLNAKGTVVDTLTLNPDGTFDNLATQNFPDGSLFYHGSGTAVLTVNPRTCIGEGDVVGPFHITGGTGAYVGASGEGVALISLRFFFEKTDAGCSQRPVRTYGLAHATGSLDIP